MWMVAREEFTVMVHYWPPPPLQAPSKNDDTGRSVSPHKTKTMVPFKDSLLCSGIPSVYLLPNICTHDLIFGATGNQGGSGIGTLCYVPSTPAG